MRWAGTILTLYSSSGLNSQIRCNLLGSKNRFWRSIASDALRKKRCACGSVDLGNTP